MSTQPSEAPKSPKKPPHTSRLANRRLRQFQFHLKEVQQVIAFLNEHGKITDNDLPKIPWVRGFQFKMHSQLKLPAGAHNQSRLFVRVAVFGYDTILGERQKGEH